MKKFLTVLLVFAPVAAFAQSKSFSFGKWVEINNAILKELNLHYVDTLPIDRMERKGVDAMLSQLDPYTIYVPSEENEDLQMMVTKSYGGIGAIISKPDKNGFVVINEPYEGSPAVRAGLRCSDHVLAVDGKTTVGRTVGECSSAMRGEAGTPVVLTVKKSITGEIGDVRIIREKIHLPDIAYYGMVNDTTGYIYQTAFTDGVGKEVGRIAQELKGRGMKRLILDLRGNGGGLLQEAVNVVANFIPKGSVVVTSRGNKNSREYVYKTSTDPLDTQLPLMVLVSSSSASASEIVAGALQDYDRALIVGTRTYGKGLVQSIRNLPYNGQLKITTAKYYTPSGRCVQAIDYAKRNEDGSVAHIPDSLTHEFKTAGGRTVRDGGGITPDVEIKSDDYSRLAYSVVVSGVLDQYVMDYCSRHESIPAIEDYHFSDADYDDFVRFAMGKDFDYRSSAKTYYDKMVEAIKEDGIEDSVKTQMEQMGKALELDKESVLRMKKSELLPMLEEEVAGRYYYQKGGVQIHLRYDTQLHKALLLPAGIL